MTRDEFVKALTIAVDAGIACAGMDASLTATDMRALMGNLAPSIEFKESLLHCLVDVSAASASEFAR